MQDKVVLYIQAGMQCYAYNLWTEHKKKKKKKKQCMGQNTSYHSMLLLSRLRDFNGVCGEALTIRGSK